MMSIVASQAGWRLEWARYGFRATTPGDFFLGGLTRRAKRRAWARSSACWAGSGRRRPGRWLVADCRRSGGCSSSFSRRRACESARRSDSTGTTSSSAPGRSYTCAASLARGDLRALKTRAGRRTSHYPRGWHGACGRRARLTALARCSGRRRGRACGTATFGGGCWPGDAGGRPVDWLPHVPPHVRERAVQEHRQERQAGGGLAPAPRPKLHLRTYVHSDGRGAGWGGVLGRRGGHRVGNTRAADRRKRRRRRRGPGRRTAGPNRVTAGSCRNPCFEW